MVEIFNFDEERVIGMRDSNTVKKTKTKSNESNNSQSNKKKPVNKSAKVQNGTKKIRKNKQKSKVVKQYRVLTPEQERRKKRVHKIVKICTIVIILLVAIILTMFSPLFNIKEIKVTGNSKITTETIMSLSGIIEGQNTYKVNKSEAESKIKEGNAYINKAKIKRILPSTLEIQVEERVATFMIEYGGGYVYIDNQGHMLEISNEKLEVPIIQGTSTEDEEIKVQSRLNNEDLRKMAIVLKIIDVANQVDIANLITRIDISNKEDYKLIFETEQKTAHLGDEFNMTNKMEYIKLFLEDEKTVPGEIFVNMDLNKRDPFFRKQI